MANTERMRHPLPSKGETSYYDAFRQFAESIDSANFASRDDRNLLVFWLSDIQYTVGHKIIWTSPILFRNSLTGFEGSLPANPSGIAIEEGQACYVNVARPPTSNYNLELIVSSGTIPPNDRSVLLFYRRGNNLFVRGYGQLKPGEDTSRPTGGGGGDPGSGFESGEKLFSDFCLSTNSYQGANRIVMGRLTLDAGDFVYANAVSTVFQFDCEANLLVQTGALNGSIKLYDVTGAPIEKGTFTPNTTQPTRYSASFTPESGVRVYEVHAGMDPDGGPYNPGEELVLWRSAIQVVTTF